MKKLFTILLSLISLLGFCQSPVQSLNYDSITQIGKTHLYAGQPDSALYYYRIAESLAKQQLGGKHPFLGDIIVEKLQSYWIKLFTDSEFKASLIDSVISDIDELYPIYSTNISFREANTELIIRSVHPIRKLCRTLDSPDSSDAHSRARTQRFYTSLMHLLECTRDVDFLNVTDEFYGRVVEEYVNHLFHKSDAEREIQSVLSHALVGCNIDKKMNMNAVVIELAVARYYIFIKGDEAVGKDQYRRVFIRLKDLNLNNPDIREWVEDRLNNGWGLMDSMGLMDVWMDVAEQCSTTAGFSWLENSDFSINMARSYEYSEQLGKAREIYELMCGSTDITDSLANLTPCMELADILWQQEDFEHAIQLYKTIEDQAVLDDLSEETLYSKIHRYYRIIGDKNNALIYKGKLERHYIYMLNTIYTEETRAQLDYQSQQMFDSYKHSTIISLADLYIDYDEWEKYIDLQHYAIEYYSSIKDYQNLAGSFAHLGTAYGYGGLQQLETSNNYLLQAIHVCDSLRDYIDTPNQNLGMYYHGIASNYMSLSVEPEISKNYYEQSIYHTLLGIEECKNIPGYTWDIKYKLITISMDLLDKVIESYTEVCRYYDLSINPSVIDMYLKALTSAEEYIPEQEKYQRLLHIDRLNFDILISQNKTDAAKQRLLSIQSIIETKPQYASQWDEYLLADDFMLIEDTAQALYWYNNVIERHRLTSDRKDILDNASYWRSLSAVSKIYGNRDWIDVVKRELVDPSEQLSVKDRLNNYFRAIENLPNFYILDSEKDKELIQYIIDLHKRIIAEYRDDIPLEKYISDIQTIYKQLLAGCISIRDYEALSPYYEACMTASLNSNRESMTYGIFSIFDRYDGEGLGELLSLAYPKKKPDAGMIYNTLLFRKNADLSVSMAVSELVKGTTDSLLYRKFERAQRLRMAIRNATSDSIEDMGHVLSLSEAAGLIRRFEEEIRKTSRYIADYTQTLNVTWQDVQSSLQPNEVAIEFSAFKDIDDNNQYSATILSAKGKPQFVYLASEDSLQKLLDEGAYSSLEALYNTIWAPIRKQTAKAKTVYFSPDGLLHNIPIEYALANGHALSEKQKIIRLSTTRLLTEGKNKAHNKPQEIYLYGGLNFDSIPQNSKSGKRLIDIEYDDIPLAEDLPGTLKEVNTIRQICDNNKILSHVFVGNQGSEDSFKQLSDKEMDILHIATHGFYLPKSAKMSFAHVSRKDSLISSYEDLSLFRSGVLLSGVNYLYKSRQKSYVEDGILTAFEIAEMNLYKTDMVVLSACETGLGDISGEGVFGLPRGLKKAGVNSILMSLWSVDDAATEALMTRFYELYLSGESKYQSLIKAQQYVRAQKSKGWDHPKYWASFILLDAIE